MYYKLAKTILPILFVGIILESFTSLTGKTILNSPNDMQKLREAFIKMEGDSEKALPVYHAFVKQNLKTDVAKAYIGTLECILAEQQGSPFSKLAWFNKGKKKIENAISSSPKNPEIRFLRLSVQVNAPGFLFYSSNLNADKDSVITNIHYFAGLNIKNHVIEFMKSNFTLSSNELAKL